MDKEEYLGSICPPFPLLILSGKTSMQPHGHILGTNNMTETIAMRLLIALMAFVYGASALPADPTITERAHLGSIEARSNSDFIGWIYDSTYSI
jgi:hypothetical protein